MSGENAFLKVSQDEHRVFEVQRRVRRRDVYRRTWIDVSNFLSVLIWSWQATKSDIWIS